MLSGFEAKWRADDLGGLMNTISAYVYQQERQIADIKIKFSEFNSYEAGMYSDYVAHKSVLVWSFLIRQLFDEACYIHNEANSLDENPAFLHGAPPWDKVYGFSMRQIELKNCINYEHTPEVDFDFNICAPIRDICGWLIHSESFLFEERQDQEGIRFQSDRLMRKKISLFVRIDQLNAITNELSEILRG